MTRDYLIKYDNADEILKDYPDSEVTESNERRRGLLGDLNI